MKKLKDLNLGVMLQRMVVGICLFGWGMSQSLAERIERAENLVNTSKTKIEAGYYDEGRELAEQAKLVLPEIKVLMELNKLSHNIKMAKLLKAEENAPEEFAAAVQHQGFAMALLEKKSFDPSMEEIRKGQEAIAKAIGLAREKLQSKMDSKKEQFGGAAPVLSIEKSKAGRYLVRLDPRKRDCLWRIAGYPEIYGDPWMWKKLYEANRDLIKDPNLIYPGQKLFIPPKEFSIQEIQKIDKNEYSVEEEIVDSKASSDKEVPESKSSAPSAKVPEKKAEKNLDAKDSGKSSQKESSSTKKK